MLAEWIKNLSQSMLEQIVSDGKAKGSRIWVLACAELQRRCGHLVQAA